MKIRHGDTYEKGFVAIATMILMVASLSVVVAMLYRSTQGNLIAKRANESNRAYQAGDNALEEILQNFQVLDRGVSANVAGSIDSTKKIPQNVNASAFCIAPSVICYDAAGTVITDPSAVKLSGVFQLSTTRAASSAARAIQASVPGRVPNPVAIITATVPASGNTIALSWSDISTTPGIESIQIRRTSNPLSAAQASASPAALLADASIDWIVPSGCLGCGALPMTATTASDTTGGATGNRYAYTLKVTNSRTLTLDSLYNDPVITDPLP
ncbi:MAG: hypothetical protein PHT88_05405 [Candidatus Moranbacteria bacterium]|nr:hypothetical protein [Candidatus Moranbacteria bacterium]